MSQGKLYVVVRTDLQKRWWAPQATHAAMQFCVDYAKKLPIMNWSHAGAEPGTLVMLGVDNSQGIEFLETVACEDDVPYSVYWEPFLKTITSISFICDGTTQMRYATKGLDLLKF